MLRPQEVGVHQPRRGDDCVVLVAGIPGLLNERSGATTELRQLAGCAEQDGQAPTHPATIPQRSGNARDLPGTPATLNPKVSARFGMFPQVAELARPTLSRWRHGFKSRSDYQRQGFGHSY